MRFVCSAPLVLILLAGLLLSGCSRKPPVHADRKPAPDFALKDPNGRTVQLSEYRGKVVLLNFWATWCGPCKIEIPWFVEFERKYKNSGFAVVGISMDEDGWDAVKPFLSEMGVNYRVVLGDDKVAQEYGGVESLPTSFIIDRDGRIAATHIGLVGKSRYENDVQELLEGSRNTRAPGGAEPQGGAPLHIAAAGSGR